MKPLLQSITSHRSQGFTLIELLVAIAVLGILSAIAAPAFTEMIAGQRVRSAASDGYASLMLARSEAMKRNTTVAVTANDATDWSQGWKVGISGTDVLKQDAWTNGVVAEGPGTGTINFLWTGRPDSGSTSAQLKFYSSAYAVQARCITLSLNGMPETKAC